MDDDDRHPHAKDVIAYNAARESARLNISCMEAAVALAARKRHVRQLTSGYISGSLHASEIPDKEMNLDRFRLSLEKEQASHDSAMRAMEKAFEADRIRLEKEIEMSEGKIKSSKGIMEKAERTINGASVFERFDPEAIGDIGQMKREIASTRDIIQRLEKRMENVRSGRVGSLRRILDATSPSRFDIRGPMK
jgi:hypothetical protein